MYVLLFYFLSDGNLHFLKFCTFYNFTQSQLINFLVSFPGYTRLNGEHYSGTDRRTLIKRRERDHLYQSGRNSEQSLLCERWSWRRRHLSPQSFIQRSEAAAVGCPPHPYPQLWQEESNRLTGGWSARAISLRLVLSFVAWVVDSLDPQTQMDSALSVIRTHSKRSSNHLLQWLLPQPL